MLSIEDEFLASALFKEMDINGNERLYCYEVQKIWDRFGDESNSHFHDLTESDEVMGVDDFVDKIAMLKVIRGGSIENEMSRILHGIKLSQHCAFSTAKKRNRQKQLDKIEKRVNSIPK